VSLRFAAVLLALPALAAPRVIVPFDADWQFARGDAAPKPVTLPHDWAIAGAFDRTAPEGGAGSWLRTGTGEYTKTFTLPQRYAKQRVFIEFDGVMANSEVFFNGVSLGKRPYGYVSFRYELTPHAKFGAEPNRIAVRVDDSRQPASRWYAGAGINRHVRLIVTDPVHVDQWATFVTTEHNTARLRTTVLNQAEAARRVAVRFTVAGKTVDAAAQTIAPGKTADFAGEIAVPGAKMWNLDSPAMYDAKVEVREGSAALDTDTVAFGFRDARFDADTGFWLNGKNFKIKGACLHEEGGAVGTAIPIGVWRRRLEALRKIGVNAIRTAHNPPAPEFLDLCDRMGFLVMDEMFDQWTVAKNPYDYHLYFREWSHMDTRDTVRRDRNHPSIILYSAGNEIRDTPRAEMAKEILKGLVEVFHANDPARPVTQALFRPNVSHDYDDGLADLLDVVGQNYRENEILAAHQQKPTRKIIGTETTHDRRAWLALRDNPAYSGQFLWAGVDYLGEARIWPNTTNSSGLLDRTGVIKPIGWERASWWSESPVVRIVRRVAPRQVPPTDPGYEAARRETRTLFEDWTPRESGPHQENVEVYSNCAEVELVLNGRSLGAQALPADASPRAWKVEFAPGTIAAACQGGPRHELRTAGAPAKLALTAERYDDVVFVTGRVVDAAGVVVPSANNRIAFHAAGPGNIIGVDNADIASAEPFAASERSAYDGACIAIVKLSGAGRLTVSASSAGLPAVSAAIEVRP
jgi:beta-galactosidase